MNLQISLPLSHTLLFSLVEFLITFPTKEPKTILVSRCHA